METQETQHSYEKFIASSVLWTICYCAVYWVIFYPNDSILKFLPHGAQILGMGILAGVSLVLSVFYGLKMLQWN